ncbi:hypothetical protein ABVK25_002977 [Lepraria finkii]|uniref:DUF6594 domain-containing protein n=1 Tax=Lepraria finkii TaxID=1340010 RepID=A0ABR4BGA6_9LECA
MQEPYPTSGNGVVPRQVDNEASGNSGQAVHVLQNQEVSIRPSSSDSVAIPFDSQSSLEEDTSNNEKRRSFRRRVTTALHISKRYKRGFSKGRVEQITHSLNEYPRGYGKVAAIENLDSDLLVYRKYGWLHNYALLHLQDELAELQEELETLDRWESSDGNDTLLYSRRLDYDQPRSIRKRIVAKLHEKLAKYDNALLRWQKVQALKRPTKRSQRNVYNLISNTGSLVQDESEWIREGPDLAALGSSGDYGWLNAILEDLLNLISRTMTKALCSSHEQRKKTGDEAIQLVSNRRFDILIRGIITLIAAVLLLVPVFLLFKLQPTNKSEFERKSNYQILTVFAFTLFFSAFYSIFTQASRQEVFAATAAFSAVLVVFLGNTSSIMATAGIS